MSENVHNIIMENRKKLTVSGVTDVDRFDENTVLLYTNMGELTVKGNDLHVNELSVTDGEMNIEGEIDAVIYGDRDRQSPLSLLGKLFR
ncbi:MAG: sporulation protein YabP [Oscillospiraceae bacterium]|nr:sporulation protein YabP [Oscillospiraceae bacterium]